MLSMASEPHVFPIVGIGASAGGLEAFRAVLHALPDDTGMAYVFVQHLAPTHETHLPELLARETQMPVHEAREGMDIRANHVYVIAPNTDMTLSKGVLRLQPRTESRGQHLSVDTFLQSLAESRASGAIGVILSGAAADGTRGLQAIKAAGGMTFAQDPTTAQFSSMPHSAITAGCVDFIGSPEAIARELTRISGHPYFRQSPRPEAEQETTPVTQEGAGWEQEFQHILHVLLRSTNTDFTTYKPTTLKRRIERRMALLQIGSPASYLTYLQTQQTEVNTLYQDLLIGVTNFFRDATTFEMLEHEILPRLVAMHEAGLPIRVWVPGCSTGEEVYSLAISMLEFLAASSLPVPSLQFFGTDLNPKAIESARAGIYPASAITGLSPSRLLNFFLPTNGGYQISKRVRELCVFARHNVLKDPPFSHLDLLSCQNMLIYLGSGAQKKVFQTFHYALSPHGMLLLGPSETIGTASELFAPLGERTRQLYVKNATRARPVLVGDIRTSSTATVAGEQENSMGQKKGTREFDLQRETDRLLATHAPVSVVVNAEMDILHFRGDTTPYLRPAPGRASLNLFKMARTGLDLALRTALSQVSKSGQPMKKEGIQLSEQDGRRPITIEVLPLQASATERYMVILFAEAPAFLAAGELDGQYAPAARYDATDRRIRDVEQELEATQQEMRFIIEELETANEELHSVNEEALSSNEELQSLNEELETTKEEIQAGNEELLVVNEELQQRNAQLQHAREFADAIVETIREPLLILDDDLRVQRANQAFYRQFQVTPANTEGYRIFELGKGQWNIPTLRTLLEELLPANHALIDYEVEHTFPRIGDKVMLLNAQRIDHVERILLAMEDITERSRLGREREQVLQQRQEFMAVASHELKTPVTSLKGYTQILRARFVKAGDEHSVVMLTKMETQLGKLITLIGELLDVTKIEAGQLAWQNEPFDLDALVRDSVEEVGYTSTQHQIRIEGVASSPVFGDRDRIGQVLTNLLSNAVKYSPQADNILVKVVADADTATMTLQDSPTPPPPPPPPP
ncbi:MAG: hypothetical protein PVSMB2_25980 [Ktedonobacteraceae bacterium]